MSSAYEKTKAWRAAHPGYRKKEYQVRKDNPHAKALKLKNAKKYIAANLEKVKASGREYQKKRRGTPEYKEASRLRGLAFKARELARREQIAGRPKPESCEICGERENGTHATKIVFDHCHIQGHFRGWLCDRCNRVLGLIKDNAELAMNMALYLERDKA